MAHKAGKELFGQGTDGPDDLEGGNGADTLFGRAGDDFIFGGNGNDYLRGGSGDDTVVGNFAENGGHGADRIYGGEGNDGLFGDNGGDRMFGQEGNDFLLGYDGNDLMHGGAGSDLLFGMNGSDQLFGGAGKDIFVSGYVNPPDVDSTSPGTDTIMDFHAGDRIELLSFDFAADAPSVIGFGQLDTNHNGVLDGKDAGIDVHAGKGTVIDLGAVFGSELPPGAEPGKLVVAGQTDLDHNDFTSSDYVF